MEIQLVPCFLMTFVGCLLKLLGRSSTSGGGGQLPPGPRLLTVIGSIHKLGHNNPHIILAKLAEDYGHVMCVRLGHATTVVVSSPGAAREVLQKKDAALSDRSLHEALRVSGIDTFMFLPTGQQWRMLRRICSSEIFAHQRLEANAPLRRRKVREMVAFVSECSDSGAAVDISVMESTTTLNLLWNTFFYVDFVDRRLNGSHEFMDLLHGFMEETGGPNLQDFFPWLRAFDPQGRGRRIALLSKKDHAIFRGGDYNLIQFGSRQRICPRLPLAFRTVHLLLASLIHRFDWRLPEGKKAAELDMTENFRMSLAMATPLRAIPVPIAAKP